MLTASRHPRLRAIPAQSVPWNIATVAMRLAIGAATAMLVQQAMPAACAAGGSCYADVGTVALNFGVDSMAATVPLALLGNASGRLNYRVFAYASPQSRTPTVVADVMPDINLAPAHVP